jgi:hypothetical protein
MRLIGLAVVLTVGLTLRPFDIWAQEPTTIGSCEAGLASAFDSFLQLGWTEHQFIE